MFPRILDDPIHSLPSTTKNDNYITGDSVYARNFSSRFEMVEIKHCEENRQMFKSMWKVLEDIVIKFD